MPMPDPNRKTANPAAQENAPDNRQPVSFWNGYKTSRGRSLRVPLVLAMLTAVVLISLRANGTLLKGAPATDLAPQEWNPSSAGASHQLSRIELPAAVEVAFDASTEQEPKSTSRRSGALIDAGSMGVTPVGFQTDNCIDPHPGTPQSRSQQLDNCHVQIWLTWTDGCAGYKVIPAPGATCPNVQPYAETITWTRCVAKHSS